MEPLPKSLAEGRRRSAAALKQGDKALAGQLLVLGAFKDRESAPGNACSAEVVQACKEAVVLLEGFTDRISLPRATEAWQVIGMDFEYKGRLAEAAAAYQAAAMVSLDLPTADDKYLAGVMLGGAIRCLFQLDKFEETLTLGRRGLKMLAGYMAGVAPAAPAYKEAEASTLQELYVQARRVAKSLLDNPDNQEYVGRHCAMGLYYAMLAAVEVRKWETVKRNGDMVIWFAVEQRVFEREQSASIVADSAGQIALANNRLAREGKSTSKTPTPNYDKLPAIIRKQSRAPA